MTKRTANDLSQNAQSLLSDSAPDGSIAPSEHFALYRDLVDTIFDGSSAANVLEYDGTNLNWTQVDDGHLANVVLNELINGLNFAGRTLTLRTHGTGPDLTATIPIATAAEMVSALSGLSGAARLPYSAVRGVPGAPSATEAGLVPQLPATQAGYFLQGNGAWAAVRSGIDVVGVNSDANITAAQTVALHTPVIRVETAFTSSNSGIPAAQRSLSVGDIFFWDAANGQWERIVDGGATGSGGGLTAQQATNLIATWARATSPSGTIPAAVLDAAVLRDRLASLAGTARLALSALNFTGTAAQIVRGDGSITTLPTELPAVSAANNGAILKVANGIWAIGVDETASGGGGLTTQQATNLIATWARATSPSGTIPQAVLDGAAIVAVLEGLTGGDRLDRGGINFGGTTAQYVRGDGTLAAFPTIPAAPPNASATERGIVELATAAEARAATGAERALTPAALAGVVPRMTSANRSTDADTLRVLTRSATDETASWVEIDLGSSAPAQPHSQTRYIGVDATTTIADAALTTGATSTSDTDDTFNAPTWASGMRYLFFAVPDDTGDITGVVQTGVQLGNVPVQRIAGTRTIGGATLKVWRTEDAWPQAFSGRELTITQAAN